MCGESAVSWPSLYLADNLLRADCDYKVVGPLPQANVYIQVETLCRRSSDVILYFLHADEVHG